MTKRIAVLGCGPAGLAAVHAIKNQDKPWRDGIDVEIFSRKRKSHLYGAQYLHAPLPYLGVRVATDVVTYTLQGTAEGYRDKVYGEQPTPGLVPKVSPEVLEHTHQAWDIRATYDRLWDLYSPYITDVEIDQPGFKELINSNMFDLIINTLPLNLLCGEGHRFSSQEIYAKGSTAPYMEADASYIVCNGEKSPRWYRHSVVFGYETFEWPGGGKPPISGVVPWSKPISHGCTCWPWPESRLLNVGRYGAWRKGYLVHHAYDMVEDVVKNLIHTSTPLSQWDDPNTLGPWIK